MRILKLERREVGQPGNVGAGANCDPLREGAKSTSNCIAEKAAQRPARSRIGTCRATKEATKHRTSGDTADGTADDLGQLTHRYLLQDRTDGLTAEDASYNLNDNR